MAGSPILLPRLDSWWVQAGGLCLGANPAAAEVSCAMSPQRSAWYGIRDIVRSICKFRKEMYDDKRRAEFEDFLRQELRDEEESMAGLLLPLLLPPQASPGFRQRSKWRKPVAHLPSPYADLIFSAGSI